MPSSAKLSGNKAISAQLSCRLSGSLTELGKNENDPENNVDLENEDGLKEEDDPNNQDRVRNEEDNRLVLL